jgi:hypothetical protein
MRCGKTTAATRKATTAATMGSGKAAASATPTMVLRTRAGRNAGGSKKDKDERDRTHGYDLHVALSLNA